VVRAGNRVFLYLLQASKNIFLPYLQVFVLFLSDPVLKVCTSYFRKWKVWKLDVVCRDFYREKAHWLPVDVGVGWSVEQTTQSESACNVTHQPDVDFCTLEP